jgi:hypothetical protein
MSNTKEESISVPGPALVAAIAVAATIATQGAGAACLGPLATMKLSSIAAVNAAVDVAVATASATISSLAAQAVTQAALVALSGEGLDKFWAGFRKPETFRTALSAGVMAGVTKGFGTSLETSSKLLNKGIVAAEQSAAGVVADKYINQKSFAYSFKQAGINFLSQTTGSVLASEVGELHAQGDIGAFAHKAYHGAAAATVGAGVAALSNGDVVAAAVGGATGAIAAELYAESGHPIDEELKKDVLRKEKELGRKLVADEYHKLAEAKLNQTKTLARVATVIVSALSGNEDMISAANSGAQTALENNFSETSFAKFEKLEQEYFDSDFSSDQWVNACSDPTEQGEIEIVRQEQRQKEINDQMHAALETTVDTAIEAVAKNDSDSVSIVLEQSDKNVHLEVNLEQYSDEGVWVDPSVNASKNLKEAQAIDQELDSFRYQKSQQQRSEITYTGSIALEQYGDQSFGLELNMGKAPGSGFERSENQLVDLGPEFRGHRLLPPESVFNETSASSTGEFLLKGAEHVCFPG